jgi:hypothetical protein
MESVGSVGSVEYWEPIDIAEFDLRVCFRVNKMNDEFGGVGGVL